jgi:3',5'-cyclic AMP phosphodiesterase CpdA
MKKILHLSDLHIGYGNCCSKFHTIILNIKEQCTPPEDYIIVITGDIVDNAFKENDNSINDSIKLLMELKNNGYTYLVIPGNHDYGNGFSSDKELIQSFKKNYYSNIVFDSYPDTYPYVRIIDEILFIGLDSTAEAFGLLESAFAQGEVGDKQLNNLTKILNDKAYNSMKKVVLLHHHPFYNQNLNLIPIKDLRVQLDKLNIKDLELQIPKKGLSELEILKIILKKLILKDSDKLMKIIENKIDVLLFGHLHELFETTGNKMNGHFNIPRIYNAGSSTGKSHQGIFRIIDLGNAPINDIIINLLK